MKYDEDSRSYYKSNKDVIFKYIEGISIENFRSMENQEIKLGKNLTLIAGKNGTMKSTILGLIAHPFNSSNDAHDILGKPLKTNMSDVFKLSLENDTKKYVYYLNVETIKNENFSEPVRVYYRKNDKENRHRITVGKDNKLGSGNFLLNTAYINLKRLFPIIETKSEIDDKNLITDDDKKFISRVYTKVLQRQSYNESAIVKDDKTKSTLAPLNTYYDYTSISSGEDNLGNIIIKMLAFKKFINKNDELQGIICIDEIEASLHPVAQAKLFDFLLEFSRDFNIQVVATTHSLYLLQHALEMQEKYQNENKITVNVISTRFSKNNKYSILQNPDYNNLYKELTYMDLDEINSIYKIDVILEDETAKKFFKSIIKERSINKLLNFYTNLTYDDNSPGNSDTSLLNLIRNGGKLISNAIVIVDGDVNIDKIKSKKVCFTKFPDIDSLPIEKRIVKFIYDLSGDDQFFIDFDKEKDAFISCFSDSHIAEFGDNTKKLKDSSISFYKGWAKRDTNFSKYIRYYTEANKKDFIEFKTQIIGFINEKLTEHSLPNL